MHTQDIEHVASPPHASTSPFWKIVAVAALVIATGYLLVYSGALYRTLPIASFAGGANSALARGCELKMNYGEGVYLPFVRCPIWVTP